MILQNKKTIYIKIVLISCFLVLTAIINFSCKLSNKKEPKQQTKPNILFVFTDQQTISAMSCSGNKYLHTPAMDQLGASGVRFEQSYCSAPVCAPSRSSIITSRMPHETGFNYNVSPVGNSYTIKFKNMGEIFRDAGYQTVWGGKWHLPESYPLRSKSTYDSIPGFDILPFYDSTKNWPEWGYGDTTDTYLADAAVSFIENYTDEKPFLLSVSFNNPHDICIVPRKPERYPFPDNIEELPPLPNNSNVINDEPELIQRKRNLEYYGDEIVYTKDYNNEDWQNYIYHYYRMTERVDKEIGRVINAIKKKGIEDNTLIIFTSDHGDGAGSHQWAAKLNLYEESTKVPFIIAWKGKIAPAVNRTLISGLDVLPTMCDYAGIEISESFLGKSLKPVIENPEVDLNNFIVTELATDPKNPTWKGRMIRMNQYKYNLYSKGERNEQLFDLSKDPGEMNNLAYDSNFQDVKELLRHGLVSWMEETNDNFLDVWKQGFK